MFQKNQSYKIGLTFDLEYWHCGFFLKKYLPHNLADIPEYYSEITERVLELLKNNNGQATFFILGKIIRENPALIKKIMADGHEISYHGFEHIPLNELELEKFVIELAGDKGIMQENFGQNFIGFRAPNFFLTKNNLEIWKILKENGFVYDSSLIGKQASEINGVKEISVGSLKLFFLEIPLGGWYFRFLPYWLFALILKYKINCGQMPVIYLHMMDLWPEIPKIKLPYLIKVIKYWGIKSSWKKLKKILKEFETVRMDSINLRDPRFREDDNYI
ncbi:hypothetical protein COX27_02190 [Candidatus Kuenenbacteria bacterium CG23_combo_of_CG06-09_8_20_14_all_36_9]|uniref:NodB homology domain-containing protein n=1 Tax=Candidatus Kuenenbacteria bacterium CG10_big_fil_rev_8_21_14_0_10_36_11 TaxID=1974618 RepID=A0A2M6WA00_9BACT|nr:MAG: hypothetical protein COX27_02190 [Candidatus Kuenenbacteria bacterium CG23_combo_of_CG06-09_8_20_14_all_36_9]PIT89623.1 MAG: hypothetical protein COU23_02945 [Candidatus Kuenenbacteria bacterium CG10_big_fil_rev_8_21_14_0_10_36_11]